MNHAEAAALLVDLEEDRLESARRQRVEEHVASCTDCTGWLRSYRELAATLRSGERAHPSSEALARFAVDPEMLDEGDWLEIERHVEACASCSADARRLARILGEAQEPTEPGAPAERPAREPRPRRWRWPVPLAAALLVAVALPVAYRMGRSAAGTNDGGPAGPVDVLVLQGAERSGAGPAALRVHEGQGRVVLAAIPPTPESLGRQGPRTPIELRVESSGGETVWSGELTAEELSRRVAERGALFLSFPARSLPSGAYRLRIEAPAPAGVLLEAPFRVTRDRR